MIYYLTVNTERIVRSGSSVARGQFTRGSRRVPAVRRGPAACESARNHRKICGHRVSRAPNRPQILVAFCSEPSPLPPPKSFPLFRSSPRRLQAPDPARSCATVYCLPPCACCFRHRSGSPPTKLPHRPRAGPQALRPSKRPSPLALLPLGAPDLIAPEFRAYLERCLILRRFRFRRRVRFFFHLARILSPVQL